MKIIGLAYDSQPGWSGRVLRTSAVTWNTFAKTRIDSLSTGGSFILLWTDRVRRCNDHRTQPDGRRSSHGGRRHQQCSGLPAARADPDPRSLDRLVGTWEISGGAQGRATYEWMEGGFFLIQHVDLQQYGQKIKGIEIIGHERPFGEEPGEEVKSRFYDNMGNTLDYVYELEGDTLTIWGGEKGSPAYYRGTFSEDGKTVSGAWHYPGGGGYEATSTRIE